MTRGEAAALLAYRVPALLQEAARGTVLITDSRRHWAQAAILLAARAGAIEVYPNHTFQPNAGMTRGEFAAVVTRVLNLVATRTPATALPWKDARLAFADVRQDTRCTCQFREPSPAASCVRSKARPSDQQADDRRRRRRGRGPTDAARRAARWREGGGERGGRRP